MSTAKLTINLDALVTNWRNLDALTNCETAAVVKANGYGLDAGRVGQALAKAGARNFFVAIAEEGVALRRALGPGPGISVFAGHMEGDAKLLRDFQLTPMLNSLDQMLRHFESLPGHAFGVQLDSGMNRLGMEAAEWAAVRDIALGQGPVLVMSHLACADEPSHPMNAQQLQTFSELTDGLDVPRSLSATGGLLLGRNYHFDLCRPGIGLYGGQPFGDALPVAQLDLPVIQIRDLDVGETVGYGNAWSAQRPSRIATVAAGYADGLHRALGNGGISVFAGDTPCPVAGRVSMDLITVDITDLPDSPSHLTILNEQQTVDMLADAGGTIGYEILTSLGSRYARSYTG
ncbi:alanine racemase [Phaeobacter italicus]|jgi:alanine racemase|uniref:Alanine racemase n=1 Tax=Phaeobacter italicus TaxID=481446 RepID=A0A0H5D3H4_9RHOB|nr:alanine racemase [Phaeobacter italicus]EEB70391.1 alanine racemase [Ruegeria sp. R11]MEC8016548.1 alanine racemase [Pseudomonadota bacterium]MBO9442999.1 alanine racemase [Phaeobacter italicus]MBY5975188.1 alanine racemase [Phaeobacter italicus]MBY6043107.1 alanine racemase [Phaeobacter italicus]